MAAQPPCRKRGSFSLILVLQTFERHLRTTIFSSSFVYDFEIN